MSMQVWSGGPDWYVAGDLADLKAAFAEHTGSTWEDEMMDEGEWHPLPANAVLTIWCTPEGIPGEVDGDGNEPVTKTAAEWAATCGRGLLASTEY